MNKHHSKIPLLIMSIHDISSVDFSEGYDASAEEDGRGDAGGGHEISAGYGIVVLKTNRMDFDGREAYRSFRAKEDVEKFFDIYKVVEDFGTIAMHGPEILEACLFLNHISILMVYRDHTSLRDHSALSNYAVVKTLQNLLWDLRVTNTSGT